MRFAEQSKAVQLLQPLTVEHVGFACLDVAHVLGIDQPHLEAARLQPLVERDPVALALGHPVGQPLDPGRFERHRVDATTGKPIGNGIEIFGGRPEFPHRVLARAHPIRRYCHIVIRVANVDGPGPRPVASLPGGLGPGLPRRPAPARRVGVLDRKWRNGRTCGFQLGQINSLCHPYFSLSGCHSRTRACRNAQSLNRDIVRMRVRYTRPTTTIHPTRRRCLNHAQTAGTKAPVLSRSLSDSNTTHSNSAALFFNSAFQPTGE